MTTATSGPDITVVTKEKVQRFLTDWLGGVSIDRDGDFFAQAGSTIVFIRVLALNDNFSVVRIWANINRNVPESLELYKFLALTNMSNTVGHLAVTESETGVQVAVCHTLLGNFLDPGELESAVGTIASLADQFDDDIKAKFGGVFYHDSGS